MEFGVCPYVERDCRKEVHTVVVALSNSEGQTAGGTRERFNERNKRDFLLLFERIIIRCLTET